MLENPTLNVEKTTESWYANQVEHPEGENHEQDK